MEAPPVKAGESGDRLGAGGAGGGAGLPDRAGFRGFGFLSDTDLLGVLGCRPLGGVYAGRGLHRPVVRRRHVGALRIPASGDPLLECTHDPDAVCRRGLLDVCLPFAHDELVQAQSLLEHQNERLEATVRQRTAALEAEVAERKRLENAKLQAERLAMVGTIAAQVAHEVRNPLGSITLNLDLIQGDGRPSLRATIRAGRHLPGQRHARGGAPHPARDRGLPQVRALAQTPTAA